MKPFLTCCLSCKLETGAYILGGAGTIFCIISFVLSFLMIGKVIDTNVPEPILVCQIVWVAIGLVCFVLLIWGTIEKKRSFLIPYLAFHFASLILIFILFVTYVAITPIRTYLTAVEYSLGICLFLTLNVYIELCVYSFYMKIEDEKLSDDMCKQFVA